MTALKMELLSIPVLAWISLTAWAISQRNYYKNAYETALIILKGKKK